MPRSGLLTQPKGSIPRASNLLLTKRGSLRVCDGTALVNAFNGVPTSGRGKAMCEFLFAPTGVARYFLRIMKALDAPLSVPQHLSASAAGADGTLPTNTYYYKVTAIDNAGGETTASNEVSVGVTLGQHVALSWNIVPNAVAYNIYRGTASGAEYAIATLIPQPSPGTLSVTYTDTGAASVVNLLVVSVAYASGSAAFTLPSTVHPIKPPTDSLFPGQILAYSGGTPGTLDGNYVVTTITSAFTFTATPSGFTPTGTSATGGSITSSGIAPPSSNTTQQTGLYAMPPASGGIAYTDANLVALFPADAGSAAPSLDGGSGGGSGGGGGTGPGVTGPQGSTPSGGFLNNVSMLPQMVQFTNQTIIALGNGYPPQVYSDATGTPTNPATAVAVTGISIDAYGVATVTVSPGHKLDVNQAIGANVLLHGITPAQFDGVFVVIAIPDSTHVKIVNIGAIGQTFVSGGGLLVTTVPIISTFTVSYPDWAASTLYPLVSLPTYILPLTNNTGGYYFQLVQGGTSAASGHEPNWPQTLGVQVTDGSAVWINKGLPQNSGPGGTAPPPPGAAHIAIYGGALFVFNTYPNDNANGIDGPTSLRMSDVDNVNSWNPVNQAFLDKDDGTEGMGLAVFTIEAQGIPPQQSMVAFKNYATYQVVSIFGAANFAIQRVVTDMGCLAPRSIQFVPGFGIARMHPSGSRDIRRGE